MKSLRDLAWNQLQKGKPGITPVVASLQQSQQTTPGAALQSRDHEKRIIIGAKISNGGRGQDVQHKSRKDATYTCKKPEQVRINSSNVAFSRHYRSPSNRISETVSHPRSGSSTVVKNRHSIGSSVPLSALASTGSPPQSAAMRSRSSSDNCKWMSVEEMANLQELHRADADAAGVPSTTSSRVKVVDVESKCKSDGVRHAINTQHSTAALNTATSRSVRQLDVPIDYSLNGNKTSSFFNVDPREADFLTTQEEPCAKRAKQVVEYNPLVISPDEINDSLSGITSIETLLGLEKLVQNIDCQMQQNSANSQIHSETVLTNRAEVGDAAVYGRKTTPPHVGSRERLSSKSSTANRHQPSLMCQQFPATTKQLGLVQSVGIQNTIDTACPVSVFNIVPVMTSESAAGKTFVTSAVNMLNVTPNVQLQPIPMVQPTQFTLPTQIGNIVVQENSNFNGQWASTMQPASVSAQLAPHTQLVQLKNTSGSQFVAQPSARIEQGFERPQYLQRLTSVPDEPRQSDTWGAKNITRKRSKRNPSPRTFPDM